MKKRILSAALVLFLLLTLAPLRGTAQAATINATQLSLYTLSDWAQAYITLPDSCLTSYQLQLTGASSVSYALESGQSVRVSPTGLITPAFTIFYWYGNVGYSRPIDGQEPDRVTTRYYPGESIVRVSADGEIFRVRVNVLDYASVYADEKMEAYIAANITQSMSVYETLEKLCQYVASFDYSAAYSSAAGMIISGGGDCWSSTLTLIAMCEKLGIECLARNGNRDTGAGSGHMNALAIISDGLYYELEAGYSGSAPRPYTITQRSSLFSYRSVSGGICVYQYDGEMSGMKRMVVPDSIDGKTVLAIGDQFLSMKQEIEQVVLPETVQSIGRSAFNSCTALKTLQLPAALSAIGEFAFTQCTALTEFTIAPENTAFALEGGVLYNKEKTSLLAAPACAEAAIAPSVTQIAPYAFYYNANLSQITIPAAVTSIGEGAFGNCSALSGVAFEAGSRLEAIAAFAFYACPKLLSANIPAGCTSIGDYSLGISRATSASATPVDGYILFGTGGSAAQDYAATWSLPFVDVTKGQWLQTDEGTRYYDCGSMVTGWRRIDGACVFFDENGLLQAGVSNEELRGAVAASCTSPGYSGDVYCLCCGEWLRGGEAIPALGHRQSTVPGTAASCTLPGLSEASACEVCGAVLKQHETLPALGHEWNAGVILQQATQSAAGLREYTCLRCGETKREAFTAQTACGGGAECPGAGYCDMPAASNWAHAGIDFMLERGYMNGVATDRFDVDGSLTRGQLVTIIYRVAGTPAVSGMENPFDDVAPGKYYSDAIVYAAANGIVNGMSETTFEPEASITREQIATILYRYAGASVSGQEALSAFSDAAAVSDYARAAMGWAVSAGLFTGDNGRLLPKENATRAQIAAILMRWLSK